MKTLKSWLAVSALSSVGVVGIACNNANTPAVNSSTTGAPATPMALGSPLYTATGMPALPASTPVGEPIVIPNAVVQFDMRMQVPAAVDAVVEMIATPLPKGTPVNPNDPDIVYHPRDLLKADPFRRLRENDIIQQGQVLARLDEQVVYLQFYQYQNMIPAIQKALNASTEAADSQKKLLDKTLAAGAGVSEADVLNQLSLWARYVENKMNSEKELIKTQGDMETAKAQLSRYFIKSPIKGKIVRIVKSQQEFCKAGETILEIQSIDRVRVEGKLDAGYGNQVRKGMQVYVEPARPLGPNALTNYHRQEVTSVAVTAHPGRPMIVSGGMDASALVWDVTATKQSHRLPNPLGVGVKAVATTGAKAKGHMVAIGGDDGKIRLWDISNPDKMPKEPVATFEDAHTGGVLTLAFSPDGKTLASASGRDVFIWSIADRKKLYTLPAEHRSDVTALKFTPQATLVSMARDKTIRTWKIGDQGANQATLIDHRGGGVDVLGVSSDGSRVLFDKDASRLDLVSLADERSVGTVQSAGGGARFGGFAIFSSDDNLILTAGADNDQRGELTVWDTPAPGNRAAERRRLVTPRNSAVSCAAFSPDPAHKFVAVGTVEGGVYFWTAPTDGDGKRIIGEVVSVVPLDTKSVQVRVELANPAEKNPGEGLQDRGAATIIIPPGGAPLGAIMPNVQNPAPAPVVGNVIPAGATIPAAPMLPATAPSGNVIPPVATPPAPMPPVTTAPLNAPPVLAPGGLGNPVKK
jgi:WD40 repeat protein